jgi:hypothetical protein
MLTWQDVLTAVRRLGPASSSVHAPHYTLVNLRTTFYTTPTTLDRQLTLIGYQVDVHLRPNSYHWHWGDGTTTTTHLPGRPYPATDITHTYRRATESGPLRLHVDTTYTAQYRVDGGPWRTIPDTLTIPGPTTSLPVRQAAAVLVADK